MSHVQEQADNETISDVVSQIQEQTDNDYETTNDSVSQLQKQTNNENSDINYFSRALGKFLGEDMIRSLRLKGLNILLIKLLNGNYQKHYCF